jgi:ribosomal protein S27E
MKDPIGTRGEKDWPTGRKDDTDKLQWHLLPIESIEEEIRVLMHGAKVYDENNWQQVENAKRRYLNAISRHVADIRKGKLRDTEGKNPSGLLHSAHISCCADFLTWFYLQDEKRQAVPSQNEGTLPSLYDYNLKCPGCGMFYVYELDHINTHHVVMCRHCGKEFVYITEGRMDTH